MIILASTHYMMPSVCKDQFKSPYRINSGGRGNLELESFIYYGQNNKKLRRPLPYCSISESLQKVRNQIYHGVLSQELNWKAIFATGFRASYKGRGKGDSLNMSEMVIERERRYDRPYSKSLVMAESLLLAT